MVITTEETEKLNDCDNNDNSQVETLVNEETGIL